MKNKFYYIFVLFILIFSISFIIFKIKEKKIDNWNITKNENNNIIENFNDLVDDMCNNAKILFDKNKNITDNPEIKKTIINAVCNDVKSVAGNNIRKEIYQQLKKKQEELNEFLKKNN